MRAAAVALAMVQLAASAAWAAAGPDIRVTDGRYDTSLLTQNDPVLAEIFSTANDIGFRVGTWGGASRDYLLGRGAPPELRADAGAK